MATRRTNCLAIQKSGFGGHFQQQGPSKGDLSVARPAKARFFQQWPGGKQGNSFPHLFAAAARVGAMDGLLEARKVTLGASDQPDLPVVVK